MKYCCAERKQQSNSTVGINFKTKKNCIQTRNKRTRLSSYSIGNEHCYQ